MDRLLLCNYILVRTRFVQNLLEKGKELYDIIMFIVKFIQRRALSGRQITVIQHTDIT